MKETKDTEIEIIDDRKYLENNPNLIPTTEKSSLLEDMSDDERRAYYCLRAQKGALTRKSNRQYKNDVKKCAQALMSGTFETLKDGTILTGAEIIAMGMYERARYDDSAVKTLLKVTGDLNETVEVKVPNYEDFIKNKAKVEW